MFSGLRFG